jgi:hypothetical protein
VNQQEKQIPHALYVITPAYLRKTAPRGLFAPHFCEFVGNRFIGDNGLVECSTTITVRLREFAD